MVITWYGKNCFKLQSGELVIVTDPFVPLRGISHSEKKESNLQPFRGRADIIIRTIAPLSTKTKQPPETLEVYYPGEYEIKNVSIKGWPITASSVKRQDLSLRDISRRETSLRSVYLLKVDELQIVLLGHLADEEEIKSIREYLEEADIIFVPAGGKPLIEVLDAAKLIRQLKPSLVIPTLFDNFNDLKPFLKELGKNEVEPQEKLTIGKKELSKEKLIIGCLKT